MECKVYHVAPVPGDEYGWEIKSEGRHRAESMHQSKHEAVQEARRFARTHPVCQIVVHRKDGTIEERRTYTGPPRRSARRTTRR
jgi:hypothetical protein